MSLAAVPLPWKLPATMEFCRVRVLGAQIPPPKVPLAPLIARLPVKVTLVSVVVEPQLTKPPAVP